MPADHLREVQYKDSSKLAARGNLYAKYGRRSWFGFVAEHVPWPAKGDVLDIGCGAGWFWQRAAERVPQDLSLTLVDRSEGMVGEALANVRKLARWPMVDGQEADAAKLPFESGRFDVALALHVLYHLDDPEAGVAEMRRVLKPGGTALIATNGFGHLRQLSTLSRAAFGASDTDTVMARFGIDIAEPMIRRHFGAVELFHCEELLRCTDPIDVLTYMFSLPAAGNASQEEQAKLHTLVEEGFASGLFLVNSEFGLFRCRA